MSLQFLFLFVVSVCSMPSHCATHWMVTDNGLIIQSVSDSPYIMKQPHSLVQFLDQERKLDEISRSRNIFLEDEKAIKAKESSDDPELEEKVRATDPYCVKAASFGTSKEPFLASYSITDPLNDLDYLVGVVSVIAQGVRRELPFCTTDLPFSMYTFDHLHSVQQRNILQITFEHELQRSLPSRFRLHDFGHYIALALQKEPKSPPLLNLAALYWRIRGDARNAVECLRRSLHFSSRNQRAQVMFALGNVVHRAGFSNEAVILYQLVLLELDNALVHMALGDALAITENRTEAIEQYEAALSRDPKIAEASVKIAALKCELTLISEMEKQHKNLLDTIAAKTSYNKRSEIIKLYEEGVRKNVADPDTRMQSTLIYEHFTYGNVPYSSCPSIQKGERLEMQCAVVDWRRYRAAVEERHRKMVAAAVRNAASMANDTDEWPVEEETETEELAAFIEFLEPMRGMDMDEPVTSPIYPRKIEKSLSRLLERYLDKNWPNKTMCEADLWRYPIPTASTLPQLFMSPENKGYSVSDLLTKYLGLSSLQEHPLPWNPPHCGAFIQDQPRTLLFQLPGVQFAASQGPSTKLSEDKLQETFVNLALGQANYADIAQRINTLMNFNIGPRWIVFNLAALYWRILGVPGEAITCLRAALHYQPERHADVALTQLAQIVMRSATRDEHLNDVAALLNTAIHVDPNEPLTHFLNGVVRLLQGKLAVAIAHIRAAVILDPLFQPAVDVLHALKCAVKHNNELVSERVQPRCCSPKEPNVYCIGLQHGGCFTVHKHGAYEANNCSLSSNSRNVCVRASAVAHLVTLSASLVATEVSYDTVRGPLRSQSIQTSDTEDDGVEEIALDFGSEQSLKKIKEFATSPATPLSQMEIIYAKVPSRYSDNREEEWEEEVPVHIVRFPESALSTSDIMERRQMLAFDAALPDTLPLPLRDQVSRGLRFLPPSKAAERNFCTNVKMSLSMLQEQTTSTWVSVTAKGVDLEQYMDLNMAVPALAGLEPVCPELDEPSPVRTLDHLPAYHLRDQFIFYKPEKALTDAFQSLGSERERIEHVAGRLTIAMRASTLSPELREGQDGGVHWTLSTASTLYWRVKGDAVNAIQCLRHSLNSAPPDMKDVALVSMANIYHQAGLLHSALIAGGAALAISPKLIAIHFTLANIYASMADYQHALQFYYSTLSLQSNFEPAKERIRAIYCHTGKIFEFHNQFN